MFLSKEFCANKLVLHSELIIFIGYKDNSYCFICYIQENIIFHSIHVIFDEELSSKYTDSHIKKHKLYNKLLDKLSLETELLVSDPFGKDEPAPVPILHILIPLIWNNSSTHSSSPSLFYKSISLSYIPRSKKSIVEIEENDNVDFNVDSNVEMQPLSPQWPLQSALQIPQEGSELRRSKH